MGRPYSSELVQLAATYGNAAALNVEKLARFLADCGSMPLWAVGSGGSLSAAEFAAMLHQIHDSQMAKAVTPLQIVAELPCCAEAAVMFVTAGGSNKDILGAFEYVARREPRRLLVVCSRTKSPIARAVREYSYAGLFDFDLPSGKDGFLATNSLIAFAVVLARAYALAHLGEDSVPKEMELLHAGRLVSTGEKAGPAFWSRKTLMVLHGPSTRPAAADMESKFTEAALGAVLLADFRNFAHGRHHWLAKRGHETAVVAFISDEDGSIAERTLSLIPRGIPILKIDVGKGGTEACLGAFVSVMRLVGIAGKARGIDPGRPGVPEFGRRIYNLRAFPRAAARGRTAESIAITRKNAGVSVASSPTQAASSWRHAYKEFSEKLHSAEFCGLVLDYDGTMCDAQDRYTGVRAALVGHLTRLVEHGIILGIATGRGKSVKSDLRRAFPTQLWGRVTIGYYNGADIGTLEDDSKPDGTAATCPALQPVVQAINSYPQLAANTSVAIRRSQVTVERTHLTPHWRLWDEVNQIVGVSLEQGVRVLESSHSVDILAPGVSKLALVREVKQRSGKTGDGEILCIGDRGRWPGNDFELLREPLSLSVDEVSGSPQTCWNLAPAGHRGVQALLDYMDSFTLSAGRFKVGKLGTKRQGS